MATKDLVTKVWIEDGCIVCDACETAAADVFEVLEETCIIRPEALTPDFTRPRSENIVDAAEECPVDVIKFDVVASEVGDEEAAPAAKASAAPTDAEAKPAAPVKSPEAPVPSKESEPAVPAAKPAAAAAPASTAGQPDPAIAALLRAATSRGGNAGILRRQASIPDAAEAFDRKAHSDLPPDAKQSKVLEAARKVKDNPDIARRGVAGGAALAVGWTAFGVGTAVAIGPAFARFMMPNVLEEPDPRVRVGPVQRYLEMEPGVVIEDFKPQGIWMTRDGNRVVALNIICTHLGCIPNWLPNDLKFKCPCHGSGYTPDGINFEGPTPRPLERFRLFVDDGTLVVDKSKKYQHELGQWDQPGSFLEV